MSAVKKRSLISVAEYLAGELRSPIKHDYYGGVVYAMSGASNAHNRIATNITMNLGVRLRGNRCSPNNSDTKIRIRLPTQIRFYYPDMSVVCRPNPPEDSYEDEPTVIFEVLSRSTRRIDLGEKRDAYLTIPSLNVYVLVEQDEPALIVYRRGIEGFVREDYEGVEAVLPLPELETELPLAEIYERVTFVPEKAPEE